MLKIKDNVDLKELEKYGFENCDEYYMEKELEDGNTLEIGLEKDLFYKNKELSIRIGAYNTTVTDLSVIYDLIKADLVEKVEQ